MMWGKPRFWRQPIKWDGQMSNLPFPDAESDPVPHASPAYWHEEGAITEGLLRLWPEFAEAQGQVGA